MKDEPWIKYKLEDGTSLFGRLIITKIFRGTDYDPTGQPVYAWSSQNLFTTIAPKTLKSTPTNPPPTTLEPNSVNTTHVDFERRQRADDPPNKSPTDPNQTPTASP